jgi:hypothetical protein
MMCEGNLIMGSMSKKEAPMLPMIVALVFCGFVLCVCLSYVNAAVYGPSSEGESGPIVIQEDQFSPGPGEEVIKGEVMRVEGDHIFVKEEDGKEVRIHIDQTTSKSHKILLQGELVEATINEENHALSIRSPDRKSEHILDSEQTMEPPSK